MAAQIELISEVEKTNGKVLKKKLLLTMTVTQLKSLCSKLFKGEAVCKAFKSAKEEVALKFSENEANRFKLLISKG